MWHSEVKGRVDLLAENFQELKRDFRFENNQMHILGALLYANEDRRVRVDDIKKAKEIIKGNTPFFSAFKETAFFALASMLSLEDYKEEVFEKTLNIYDDMKTAGFHGSVYLTLAAFLVSKNQGLDSRELIRRTREFYDAMKREHRFLTSTDDYGFAALLATSDLEVEQAVREMETCYGLLKGYFGKGNVLQSLTHILALGEETADAKCKRVIEIFETFKEKGCKPNKYGQLSTLGTLVLISKDVENITDEIKDAYDMLLTKKGFGKWNIGKHDRLMYSSALVANVYIEDIKTSPINISLANSVTNIVIAQQTAAICAASGAAAAASVSN